MHMRTGEDTRSSRCHLMAQKSEMHHEIVMSYRKPMHNTTEVQLFDSGWPRFADYVDEIKDFVL